MIFTTTINNNPACSFSFEYCSSMTCVFSYEHPELNNKHHYLVVSTDNIEQKLQQLSERHINPQLVICGTSVSAAYLCKRYANQRAFPNTTNIFVFTNDDIDNIKRLLSGQVDVYS
jgi:glutaredoxin-related protein